MQGLFSVNSKLMAALSRIVDLVVLNVIYLLTCLPILTIGAANTALYTVCFRFGTSRESGICRSYFKAFRENFKQATGLWLLILLYLVCDIFNIFLFLQMEGDIKYIFVVFAVLGILILMVYSYTFPQLSQFVNTVGKTLRNSIAFTVAYLPQSIVITAVNILPFAVMILFPYLYAVLGLFWCLFYFSCAACINVHFLRKIFAPYIEQTALHSQKT